MIDPAIAPDYSRFPPEAHSGIRSLYAARRFQASGYCEDAAVPDVAAVFSGGMLMAFEHPEWAAAWAAQLPEEVRQAYRSTLRAIVTESPMGATA